MKWVRESKHKTGHPSLENYNEIQLIVRFLNGFNPEALEHIFALWSALGDKGLANKPFPLAKGVIRDPRILTSDAFSSGKDKARGDASPRRPPHSPESQPPHPTPRRPTCPLGADGKRGKKGRCPP